MKTQPVVLFDFDGVLVDTFVIALGVYKNFFPDITEDQYRNSFLGNIFDSVKKHEQQNSTVFDVAKYYRQYTPLFLAHPPIDGILEAIKKIALGRRLAVVSSTASGPIRDYLEKYGFAGLFSDVYGGDVHKSKVVKIKMALETYDTASEHTVFITDTLGDMLEAQKCNVASIGVTWGYHPEDVLAKGHPLALAKTPEELSRAVESFFNN